MLPAFFSAEESLWFMMHDSKKEPPKRVTQEQAVKRNKGSYGIFFAVNQFEGEVRQKITLTRIRAFALDLENASKTELTQLIKDQPLEPTYVVETKNGFHVYYLLTEPLIVTDENRKRQIDAFDTLMEHLIPYYQLRTSEGYLRLGTNNKPMGADPNAVDVCRILRVPGFDHLKDPEHPYPVRLCAQEIHPSYTYEDLLTAFPLLILKSPKIEAQVAPPVKETPNYNIFWDLVASFPVEEALRKLSGRPEVNNETYSFKRNSNGTTQIIINDKASSCWIDTKNKIGSYDHGGPTIIQWLKWFGHSYDVIAAIAQNVFNIQPIKKPTNYQLMLQITKQKDIMSYQGNIYKYSQETHVWEQQEPQLMRQFIHRILLDNNIDPTSARVNDIFSLALDHYFQEGQKFNTKKAILTFKNTCLDISHPITLQEVPFSHEYYSTILLPYDYDPSQTCPRWERFIKEVLPDPDLQLLVQEMFGYCLTTNVKHHVAFFLDGGGRNGKSTLMEILSQIVGVENVSSVSFHSLSERFGLQPMENKLVNYDPEISAEHMPNTAIFKAIVGGDPVEIERKFQDSYRTRFFCKLVYAANELPTVRDKSTGFFSRLIILPFDQEFTEERGNIDKNLLDKLIPELSGIFNWSLLGLKRLTINHGFTRPQRSMLRLEEYKVENNSLLQFIEMGCSFNENYKTTAKFFYESYVAFCKNANLKAFSIRKVGLEMGKVKKVKKTISQASLYYEGIEVKTEY